MPNFNCKVMDASGTVIERNITAPSIIEIHHLLGQMDQRLLSATKKSGLSMDMNIDPYLGKIGLAPSKKLSIKELNIFTRQLELLLNTGIALLDALDALEQAVVSEKLKKVVQDLRTSVSQGDSLSDAMANNPEVFDNFYVNMVRAGEASGQLPNIFNQIRDFVTRNMETQKKIKKALRYPTFVIIALFIAGYIQITVVMPKMAKTLFSNMSPSELPLPTKIMLGIGEYLSQYIFVTVFGIIALFAIVKYIIDTPSGGLFWDRLKLNIPKIGSLVQAGLIARFGQIFRTLVGSGVKIENALEIASDTVDNKIFEKDLIDAKKKVLEGIPLSIALEGEYMPQMATSLINIGERTGALVLMLESLAEYFSAELDDKMDAVMGSMEPVLTLLITAFVGVFVLAVFMPMVQNMINMM
ncbi:MAG: hypothetical protein CMG74_02350 [Candidatus Marinimicrobia bacterium]|nr:hypothetical protein [Candidatus Neomarinimicrobiota bacterium]